MAAKKNSKNASVFHGLLLVDKPAGITSHDVVDRVRRIFETRRVGHTGTLDPQATGLLVLLIGEATKISEYLIGLDKSYEGTLKLGVVSDSYDTEGVVEPGPGGPIPSDLEKLQDLASELTGEIDQIPPPFSAKKVGGKKLYEYARKGTKSPEVAPRKIRVDDFELLNLTDGSAEFGIDCSSGTYVRSLVHELGQLAGCGAVLTELRRTDVGPFGIENAHTLEQLQALESNAEKSAVLIPLQQALPALPSFYLGPGAEPWVRRGQAVPHNMVHREDELRASRGSLVLLCRFDGTLVAVARLDPAPMSPPPKAMIGATPPWYQPLRQFDIGERVEDEDAGETDEKEAEDEDENEEGE